MLYPLSHMDLDQSIAAILLVNVFAVIALLMGSIINDLAQDDLSGWLHFWGPVYIALYGGIYLTITYCQINLIIVLVLWLFWRDIRCSHSTYRSGAALVAGAVAKPHYALLMVGASPKPGQKLIISACTVGTIALLFSIILVPSNSWHTWSSQIVGDTNYAKLPEGYSSIAAPWNRSIAGFVARFFVPNRYIDPIFDSPDAARIISITLVTILFVFTASTILSSMRRATRSSKDRDLELSIISIFLFLASPASWTHHLVMLLRATLVMLRDGVLDRNQSKITRIQITLVLAVIALTFDDLIPREIRISSRAIMSLMTIAIVALWLLAVARLKATIALDKVSQQRGISGN